MDASSSVEQAAVTLEVNFPCEGAIEEGHTMDASLPVKQSAVAKLEKVDLPGANEMWFFFWFEGFIFVWTSLAMLAAVFIAAMEGEMEVLLFPAFGFCFHLATQLILCCVDVGGVH